VASQAVQAGDLTAAVQARDIVRVKALLASGADANEKTPFGSPLNIAVSDGQPEIVTVLLDAGANIESAGPGGRHPLHSAAARGRSAVAELLIARGAKVDALDESARTPLIFAAQVSAMVDSTETVRILLKAAADPRKEDGSYHMSALHFAAAKGSVSVVGLLLDAGVDVNLLDGQGDTALHHAAADGRRDVVEFLIAHGANTNIADKDGKTPLKLAAASGEIHELLLKAGAKE
jgi:ankyrin repeat protein